MPTDHPKILRARDAEADEASAEAIAALIEAARENRPADHMRQLLSAVVPEYSGPTGDISSLSELGGTPDEYDIQTPTGSARVTLAEVGGRAVG